MFKMPTITIDPATCTNCGTCADICASGIFIKDTEKKVRPDPANFALCISCGQCMMSCPEKAVHVEGLDYERDFTDWPGPAAAYETFRNTMIRRRSVRCFQQKPIPREVLEEIGDFLRHAPFGVEALNAAVTVINDRKKIEEALPVMLKRYQGMRKFFGTWLARILLKPLVNPSDYNTIFTHLLPLLDQDRFFNTEGEDWICRGAPAVMLFHGRKDAGEYVADSWIMINYAMISAQYHGLGSTIIGLIPPVVNQSGELRKIFGIPEGHKVVCALILGYPKHRYLRSYKAVARNITYLG